jgi:acyl carrier protein
MESVADVIRDLLVDKFGVFGTEIGADTTFEELDIDSLVLIELSVVLGRRYGVRVQDGDLISGQTIAEAAALVEAKRVAA